MNEINTVTTNNKRLIVHKVNVSHIRLVELTKLADQAKPFYDWVERRAKNVTKSSDDLTDILFDMNLEQIKQLITDCYESSSKTNPILFDGVGRTYPHNKACFYFFAWIIRDAPQQRLAPLISKMRKEDHVSKLVAEINTLAELIYEYRDNVKNFNWDSVREVISDRLEGSRRSISGHLLEANIRTALATAFQNYYSINMNYGNYEEVIINNKQIKIGQNSIDISADLIKGDQKQNLFIPVKTRETQGGGHAHLFSRDIITAITDIKKVYPNARIGVVIVSENWSANEVETILEDIDVVFHFDMNPNELTVLDEISQRKLNLYIEKVLQDEHYE